MAGNKAVVVQTAGKEIPTEIIANALVELADGMKQLRRGRLNERAIIILLHHSTGGTVAQKTIKEILRALEDLAKDYVK